MDRPVFVIGDVHGCYYTLKNLVSKLPKGSQLIFVGDLCDYGRYSREVVEFVMGEGHRSVVGNHDIHMLLHLKEAIGGKSSPWSSRPHYGAEATIASYRKAGEDVVERHLEWIASLPHLIEERDRLITHGFGLPFYRTDHPRREFYMRVNRPGDSRYLHLYDPRYTELQIVNIFGHHCVERVMRGKNHVAIDTGCKMGRRLSAVELESLREVSVPAQRKDFS